MQFESLNLDFENEDDVTAEGIIDTFFSLSCPKIDQVIQEVINEDEALFFQKLQSTPSIFAKVITNNKDFCVTHFDTILEYIVSDITEYSHLWQFLIKQFPRKSVETVFKFLDETNLIAVLDPVCKFAMEDGLTEELNSYESKELVLLSNFKDVLIQSNLFILILHKLAKSPEYFNFFSHVSLFYPELLQVLIVPELTKDLNFLFFENISIAIDFSDLICQKLAYPVIDLRNNIDHTDCFIKSTIVDISVDFLNLMDAAKVLPLLIRYLTFFPVNKKHITYNAYVVYNPLSFKYLISMKLLLVILKKSPECVNLINEELWLIWIEYFTKYPHNTQFQQILYEIVQLASDFDSILKLVFVKLEFIKYLVIVKNKKEESDAHYFMFLLSKLLNEKLQKVPEICECAGWEELLGILH